LENGDSIVGFRPEHLLPLEGASKAAATFRLQVKNKEYLGAEWILYGTIIGGKFDGKELVSRLGSAASLQADHAYDFGVWERELHFFDRQTEKRTEAKVLAWR
jgi:multiple sugar transport system ATP-binding protein